jgi:MoaD family protein
VNLVMQISVRFFTRLREITGKREETVRFPKDKTIAIRTVLEALSKRYGKDFTEYIYDKKTGEARSYLQFLVNGRGIPPADEMDVKLSDGDVLAIIPPVGGG